MRPTRLLNDDGSASMATALMMSHHAFRRDLARFAAAVAVLDPARIDALREEWTRYRGALHGHHQIEDANIFPSARQEHPALNDAIDQLVAHHQQIDPLLERADRAFAALPETREAAAVLAELAALLDVHLDLEEATVIPTLRGFAQFPPPATDDEAAMYADGFAWSAQGIAPDVLDKVFGMLAASVRARLADARSAFDVRCTKVWGPRDGSRTSNP